ncbi:hypothetical protein O6H91_19G022000 [Diphasiastrum complanatum]|nr:hypothetical protein O6H91_19G022000 [Diphasiastrum complanatum]
MDELGQVSLVEDSKHLGKELGKGFVAYSHEHHCQGHTANGQKDTLEGKNESLVCAICLEKVMFEETSLVKGCDHMYCVTCILRWASYKTEPWCPQCRLAFSSLYVYKALDGSLNDFLMEESVCLLLRAAWFKAIPAVNEIEEQDDYLDDDDCYEEYYYTSNVRLGNRRWGDSGYVRGGRKEARPVSVRNVASISHASCSSESSSVSKKEKTFPKESGGRRAKRAQRREAADQEAALKSQGNQKQQQQLKGRRALH